MDNQEEKDFSEDVSEFGLKVAELISEYARKVPLHLLCKVLANHQIDLTMLAAQGMAQHVVRASRVETSLLIP